MTLGCRASGVESCEFDAVRFLLGLDVERWTLDVGR